MLNTLFYLVNIYIALGLSDTVLSTFPKLIHLIFLTFKVGMIFISEMRKQEPQRGVVTCV